MEQVSCSSQVEEDQRPVKTVAAAGSACFVTAGDCHEQLYHLEGGIRFFYNWIDHTAELPERQQVQRTAGVNIAGVSPLYITLRHAQ